MGTKLVRLDGFTHAIDKFEGRSADIQEMIALADENKEQEPGLKADTMGDYYFDMSITDEQFGGSNGI